MLATQVEYWKNQEIHRHNLVAEDQGQQNIDESIRHNKRSEALIDAANKETRRHNKASEAIGMVSANAAATSASAAYQNALTNENRAIYQNALNAAQTKHTKASIAQGWVNAISGVIGNVGKLVPKARR